MLRGPIVGAGLEAGAGLEVGAGDAVVEPAADGLDDAVALLDEAAALLDEAAALSAACTKAAGSACTAGCAPGTPSAFGLDDGAADGDEVAEGLGVVVGDAVGEVVVDGLPDWLLAADGDAVGVTVAVAAAVSWTVLPAMLASLDSYTCRMLRSAVSPIWARASCLFLPGTDTTMFDPSVSTCALPTPKLLTRCRMMSTAVLSSLFVTFTPPAAFGVNVTVVPPRRSRPSAGEYRPPRAISP